MANTKPKIERLKPVKFVIAALACVLVLSSIKNAPAMEVELTRSTAMIPDGDVAQGDKDIRSAWLSSPTERYAHGVLGDGIEAAALTAVLPDGTRLTLSLPEHAVFEDRYPRLADLDGDGRDELVVVKATQTQGASLLVAGLRDGKLTILAEGAPIGRPYRWLNPVGAGDFDGDGETELAYVETPHIGGILRILKWRGDKLIEVYSAPGFSNHAIGTRELELSTVMDADGDGITDLIVPNTLRNVLRVVTFKGGVFKELFPIDLGAPLVRLKTDYKSFGALVAILADGHAAGVRFKKR